ncbi:MAG: catalase HPII, partial [Gemmatimonadaceae bacterium]
MPKKKARPASTPVKSNSSMQNAPAKAASRKTSSAPSHLSPAPKSDRLAKKEDATQKLVATVPWNSNKPGEFGRENAVNPPIGFSVAAASQDVGSSTISESNPSDKTGSGDPPAGVNPLNDPLDRVRV